MSRILPILGLLACTTPVETKPEPTGEADLEPQACGYTAAPDLDPAENVVEVDLVASALRWDPGTGVELDGMAFGGTVPGPLIEVTRGQTLRVNFRNDLTEGTSIHWHGLQVPQAMDGIDQMMMPVMPGETFVYEFPVRDAGFYWYHPHMQTDTLLERGLYGAIIAHDPAEIAPDCDLPLVLDDVLLDEAGAIAPPDTDMNQLMGRLGNVLMANGRSDRSVAVTQGQSLLLRLVNASNARFWDISLESHVLNVVATDDGWLDAPVPVESLVLAPGERYIVQVDATGEPGTEYRLMNRRFQLHEDGGHMVEYDPLGEGSNPVMRFVYGTGSEALEPYVVTWGDVPDLEPTDTVAHHWVIDEDMMGGTVTIDGASYPDVPLVSVESNQVTTFEIENVSEMHHPMHIHGLRFAVADAGGAPEDFGGWKDTWIIPPRSTVTLVGMMENPGSWFYHCHILEHAEDGMAGFLEVR